MTKYQEFIPHELLQGNIKRFWILEKEYTEEDNFEEILPDACIELVLNFGSPYLKFNNLASRELPQVFLIGLQNQAVTLQACGIVKVVAVRFFAWGILPFFKHEVLPDTLMKLELDDKWRTVLSSMASKINADEYQIAVEELEDFLLGKRFDTLFDAQQVQAAAKLLYRTKGQFRIAELADHFNLSVRQLQRQFDDATGVSPKNLARTIRFNAVCSRLMEDPNASLTALAHEFGYSDQAHFINDFKAFIDKTPSQYAAELQDFRQILEDQDNVVFLQSPSTMPDYTEDDA